MNKTDNLRVSIEKELDLINKSENKLKRKSRKNVNQQKSFIEEKIPQGLNETLQKAFSKAFGIIFKHGIGIIEKCYDKNDIAADFDIHNYAINKKCSRKELKRLKWSARKSDLLNMSITTVEGVGLGALGIGLPDIVIFIGMILKGIYEVSLRYGYDYDSTCEKYFILTMMKAALTKGEEWDFFNKEVDNMISSVVVVSDDVLQSEIEETSRAFATNMLVLKFIQGMPIVGIVGGMFNPIYYSKIMNYVRLKYHKRYLTDKLEMM